MQSLKKVLKEDDHLPVGTICNLNPLWDVAINPSVIQMIAYLWEPNVIKILYGMLPLTQFISEDQLPLETKYNSNLLWDVAILVL